MIVMQSEARLSQEAIAFWTSFIASGNPSATEAPARIAWTPFTSNSPSNTTAAAHNRIVPERGDDEGTKTKTVTELIPAEDIERCNFWMSANVTAETRV